MRRSQVRAPSPFDDGQDLRAQLRAELLAAMRGRETEVVSALRSAIAAVENAEAVAPDEGRPPSGSAHIAGAAYGAGATEACRRAVTAGQVRAIIAAQVVGRALEAERWEAIGRHDRAGGCAMAQLHCASTFRKRCRPARHPTQPSPGPESRPHRRTSVGQFRQAHSQCDFTIRLAGMSATGGRSSRKKNFKWTLAAQSHAR